MALAYLTGYGVVKGGAAAELQRITMAAVRAALDVSAESAQTTNHANRVKLANAVLLSPDTYGQLFAFGIAVDSTAAGGMTDANYLALVKQNWDAYAGVA